MLDRRTLLLGATALAGCANAAATGPSPDPAADVEFRTFVDRLAERSRVTRPFLLRQFNTERLTPEGRILYDTLIPGAEADAALAQLPWGDGGLPYAVTHRNGAYRRTAITTDELRLLTRDVTRDTNQLEGDAGRGVIAPDFEIDAAIPLVEAAYTVASGGGEAREQLATALARQLEVLRRLRRQADPKPGVWRLPGGEAFYAHALQFQLGAPVDPVEAHGRALARCRELQAEADVLLRRQGLSQGAVAERLRALARDPRSLASDDASKTRAVAAMNERLPRTRALLTNVIDGVRDAPADVRRLDRLTEANGTQGRRQGNVYLVDLGAPRPMWSLASVAHHEALPGHILQARFERSATPPALQLHYAGGYSEGWAIYAEQLADEAGAFENDPLGRIGYLQWMLFRLARVVADTGIHALRWDRARAIAEMRALQGDSIAFVSIEDDVGRFCAQPGAFAAQGLAALHITELRERTRRTARERFSLMRFHAAILTHGPLSPPGLEQATRAAFSA